MAGIESSIVLRVVSNLSCDKNLRVFRVLEAKHKYTRVKTNLHLYNLLPHNLVSKSRLCTFLCKFSLKKNAIVNYLNGFLLKRNTTNQLLN